MEIINQTPFKFANIVGQISFPQYSLTFIVKGTFDLQHQGLPSYSEDQLYPVGDTSLEDEMNDQYSTDFAYYKPQSDLLLAGKAYAPDGLKIKKTRVTFQVGEKSKSLAVFGDRYWDDSSNRFTDPVPFKEMELGYVNSFGGVGFLKNPIGKGLLKKNNQTAMPNIEALDNLISSSDQRPDPAGFGPIDPMWEQRSSKLGSYDKNWLENRWPWYPEDFKWEYYNVSPADMRVKDYLKGDESLYFENLHSEYPQYHSQLPGGTVRLFLNELQQDSDTETQFKEIPMKLDTLWVDMETEKLILVWRGIAKIQSEDFTDIKHAYIAAESLAKPVESIDYHQSNFQRILDEEKTEEEVEEFDSEGVEDEINDTSELDLEIAKAEKQARASMIEAGIDPDNLPEPTAEDKAEEAKLLKELGFEEEVEEVKLNRKIVKERILQGDSFTGEDLIDLDLSELDMQGINFQSANFTGANLKNVNLSDANLEKTNLTKVDLSHANMQGVNLQDADLTSAVLTEVNLTGANLEDAIFESAIVKNAVLVQVNAKNAYFTKADLSHAKLIDGNFEGADFSKTVLNKANFHKANLDDVSIQEAVGEYIDMSEANLTGLRASDGCNFSHGDFKKTIGQESIWEGATLVGADFSFSHMEGADFTSANLSSANLTAANMKFSRFNKANLKESKLLQMNLFQGSLEKADLSNADLRGSNFYGVEFFETILKNARLENTNLKMTKLSKERT